jgi:hypothetical protein
VVFAKADSGNDFDSISSSVRKLAKTKSVNLAVRPPIYR